MPRQSVSSRPPRRSLDHGGRSALRHETHRGPSRHATTDDSRRVFHGESSRNSNTERKLRRAAPEFPATPPLTPESSDLAAPRELPHQEPSASTHSQPRFDTPADDDNVDMSPPAAEQSPPLNDFAPTTATYSPERARSIDGEMNRQNHATVMNENALPAYHVGNHMAQVLRPPGLERTDLPAYLHWWDGLGVHPRSKRRLALDRPPDLLSEVRYEDLQGDRCDFQGVDWEALGTTRGRAREMRPYFYKPHTSPYYSDGFMVSGPTSAGDCPLTCREQPGMMRLPHRESFFRFKRMDIRRDAFITHFQLRSLLACPSRSQTFYASTTGVQCFNPISRTAALTISTPQHSDISPVTALDAGHGLLVAGTLHGSYYIQPYEAESRDISVGKITHNRNPFINHINIHTSRRSSAPLAAFASNDCKFKVMDLARQEFILDTNSDIPINRTAVSPDGQMRVVVGDGKDAHIVSTERECHVRHLTGHCDYLFGCAWCQDGWMVATSSQDKTIKIWDARRWCNSSGVSMPLKTIFCDMDVAPNLCFSPLGSGRRVLVAAESADFVHMIDAQTFASKQTFDIFGEIGGVSFTNDGQDLSVLCADPYRGGLLQLERCGRGSEPAVEDSMVPRELAYELEADGRSWLSANARPTTYRRPTIYEAAPPI